MRTSGGREGGREGEIERCGGDITSEMRIASSEVHSEIFVLTEQRLSAGNEKL